MLLHSDFAFGRVRFLKTLYFYTYSLITSEVTMMALRKRASGPYLIVPTTELRHKRKIHHGCHEQVGSSLIVNTYGVRE